MRKVVRYHGRRLLVKGGIWLDQVDACFYEVVEMTKNFVVCREYATGDLFAVMQYDAFCEV